MRAITLTTWMSIACLLSSIPAWGQEHTPYTSCSEFGFCFGDVGRDLQRTDYNIYYHPFLAFRNPSDDRPIQVPFPEDCTICDGRVDKDEAGYELMIFSKDQDPIKGQLFDRPILVTQGFDALYGVAGGQFDFGQFEQILDSVYDPKDGHLVCDEVGRVNGTCTEINLLRQLYDEGYDIALLLWKNPGIDIKTNALATLEALRWLDDHTNKREGSETIVIGPSLGGMVTRYALQLAGDQNSFPHIRVRVGLFIAFDSPNRGAEIPLSLQATASYFRDQDDTVGKIFSNLSGVAARQLLLSSIIDRDIGVISQKIRNYENPHTAFVVGCCGNPGGGLIPQFLGGLQFFGCGIGPFSSADCAVSEPMGAHSRFMQEINEPAFRAQIKNIVHPVAGIMQRIHTAAIVNGSGIGMPAGYTKEAHLYASTPFNAIFDLDLHNGSTSDPTSDTTSEVFHGDILPHFGFGESDKDPLTYSFGEPAFVENAPGGQRNTYAFITDRFQGDWDTDEVDLQYFKRGVQGVDILFGVYPFGIHSFIPTLSGFGMLDRRRIVDSSGRVIDPGLDINNNESWFTPFMTEFDEFTGITRVQTNRQCNGFCMFDEVFAPEDNQRHVSVTTQNKQWFLDLIHTYGPRKPGDIDGDGDVDRDDLTILLQEQGKSISQSACGARCDLNGDGQISNLDAHELILLCTRPQCATQ